MIETELTLVVPGAEGVGVLDELVNADEMAGCRPDPPQRREIHDIYWDTPRYDLARRGFALRLREQNGAQLVALKGNAHIAVDGLIRRLEIEGVATEGLWEAVTRALVNAKIPVSIVAGPDSAPTRCLRRAGLQVIQDRRTRRVARTVAKDSGEAPLVELALDTVYYQAGNRLLVHREIELEAIDDSGVQMLRHLAAWLRGRFKGTVVDWVHNKLVTGLALEKLSPTALLSDGALGPEVYQQLEDLLTHNNGPALWGSRDTPVSR